MATVSKLDRLRASIGDRADESMGASRQAKLPRRTTGEPKPEGNRWSGLIRPADSAIIPVDRIGPDPDQPRKEFDGEALGRLAESLKARGQLQPIRVRWVEERGQYVIIAGERRWRAALLAGLPSLAATIDDRPMSADELLTVQMVENCSREDLAPLDQARAIRALLDREGWSQARLADELGVNQSTVSRSLALLELPEVLRDRVVAGELAAAVARELARVPDPSRLPGLVKRAIADRWGKAQASGAVRALGAPLDPDDPAPNYAPCITEALRTCRVCGCTDADCSGCIERTGEPCSWVEDDLCSACDPDYAPCITAGVQDRAQDGVHDEADEGDGPRGKYLVCNAKGASLYCLNAPSLDVAESWARSNHPVGWGGTVEPISDAEWVALPSWVTTRDASGSPSPIHVVEATRTGPIGEGRDVPRAFPGRSESPSAPPSAPPSATQPSARPEKPPTHRLLLRTAGGLMIFAECETGISPEHLVNALREAALKEEDALRAEYRKQKLGAR